MVSKYFSEKCSLYIIMTLLVDSFYLYIFLFFIFFLYIFA